MGLEQDDYRSRKTNVEKMSVLGEVLKDRGENEIGKESRRSMIYVWRERCESNI